MNTQEHLNQLTEIKSLMERSSRCLSLSGLSGVAAGSVAILCGSYAWWYIGNGTFATPVTVTNHFLALPVNSQTFLHLLMVAAFTLVFAIGTAFFFTWQNSQKKGLKIWDASTKNFLINLFLPLIAGGLFCLALIYHGELYLLASTTLVFYGLALLNASRYTHREIRYLGISEIVLGLVSLYFIGYGILFWLFGFGLLHIVYGLLMYAKHEKV
ncbi:hypothetical protein KDU71_09630 [Carboxylicivirga sediminis]|uniref:Uncharacterized protein n=1 Tax=Carboxylicivirga sediminis TaxID=2006564 RepID=A0A941IXU3_9BACT|nr:hypothetical protein [Carboxylicivirga sediminis]MBR8535814.1 hypothetical protein [Carboxylicivirga sediminis]